ncbi:MAG: prephenate dehydrogenase [Thermoanaerobacteraceae bacterium]|nr:prephenate dehydrogenase [Thermoanaerobacteraceae bacterium]
MLEQITIIGVGLMGGSLGLAICRRGLARRVMGVDPDAENRRLALEAGAVHRTAPRINRDILAGAEMIILATPVGQVTAVLEEMRPHLSPGTVVTDVGSTKARVCARAAEIMPPGTWFVGGHPMAGSEYSGMAGADPYLFENAYYILTPPADTPGEVVERVEQLVAGVGARVVRMTPEEHDRAVAAVSHLPHLAAAALVNTLMNLPEGESFVPLAAGGFRDTTRIAGGNPLMWRDIFLSNQGAVLESIKVFREQLDRLEGMIAAGDGEGIRALLEEARTFRRAMRDGTRGYLPVMYEIVAAVPDRPGMIAGLARGLGDQGINICDIEILRVREGEGGSIRLAFATEKEQEQAAVILRQAGYQVVKR